VPLSKGLDPFLCPRRTMLPQHQAHLLRTGLDHGDSCWQLLQFHGYLTFDEVILMQSAERTSNLPWALNTLADNLDRRNRFRMKALFEVLRPTVSLMIGLMIAFVSFALFLPLIKLLNDLS
ncbi:MAG: type II secretion system F family protein, partial [Planctomycetes bacterium]|nr:type II secretion system F family protein [Planctomycetota bacterium]